LYGRDRQGAAVADGTLSYQISDERRVEMIKVAVLEWLLKHIVRDRAANVVAIQT
jgi:hypothetical protein